MNFYDIIFYIFAAITLLSALFVVTTRNIVHSAFYLLFTFWCCRNLCFTWRRFYSDLTNIDLRRRYINFVVVRVMLTNKITTLRFELETFICCRATP